MSYGKHHESMYEGSMIGSGAVVFAVWGYIIAKMKPGKDGMQLELNPKLLAFTLGEPEQEVRDAILFLCAPDKESRSKEEEGRRLIRIGEYAYRVVNGMKYRAIRDEETRRQQVREAQARHRAKKAHQKDPLNHPDPDRDREALRNIVQGQPGAPEGAPRGTSPDSTDNSSGPLAAGG